jgi:hypothetical protein
MELELPGQIFEKYSSINLHENSSFESGVAHGDGRMVGQTHRDGHDESNSRFSHFFEGV